MKVLIIKHQVFFVVLSLLHLICSTIYLFIFQETIHISQGYGQFGRYLLLSVVRIICPRKGINRAESDLTIQSLTPEQEEQNCLSNEKGKKQLLLFDCSGVFLIVRMKEMLESIKVFFLLCKK